MPKSTATQHPTPTSRPRLRALICTTTGGREEVHRLIAEVSRLEALYLKRYKRKLEVDLFVSSWGNSLNMQVGITAHYNPEQESTVSFLRENVEGGASG